MDFQTSLNRIEELFRIMYLGLWVLWAETRWIAGPDIGYQRRLTLMRRRQGAIQDELSRMATLADPRREQLAGDLALLEGDIVRLEKDREAHRAGTSPAPRPVRVAALRRMGVEQDALRRETFLKKRSLPRAFRRGAHPSFSKGFPHRANASAGISFFSGKRYRRNQ